jgi:hypothetical protein
MADQDRLAPLLTQNVDCYGHIPDCYHRTYYCSGQTGRTVNTERRLLRTHFPTVTTERTTAQDTLAPLLTEEIVCSRQTGRTVNTERRLLRTHFPTVTTERTTAQDTLAPLLSEDIGCSRQTATQHRKHVCSGQTDPTVNTERRLLRTDCPTVSTERTAAQDTLPHCYYRK